MLINPNVVKRGILMIDIDSISKAKQKNEIGFYSDECDG